MRVRPLLSLQTVLTVLTMFTVFTVLLVLACIGVPPAHADGAARGECHFPSDSITVREGESPHAVISFINDSTDTGGWFTATLEAGFHYWHDRVVHRQLLTPQTGLVQADVDLGPAYAPGLGEPSGIRLDITSTVIPDLVIGTCSAKLTVLPGRDSDHDGLLDVWESNGIDYDGDGQVDLALNQPPYSADPNHKDIFLELDSMFCAPPSCPGNRDLSQAAITQVQAAFAAHGITLHVRPQEHVFEAPSITFDAKSPNEYDDFDDIKWGSPDNPCDGGFGDVLDRLSPNCENVLGAKRLVFRYALSATALTGKGTTSGTSEAGDDSDLTVAASYIGSIALPGGNDLVVSLGTWTPAMFGRSGGQTAVEAGTLMHELGHTLGLQHGGVDSINCKPNYLSVMNYTYQVPDAAPNRPLDYQPADRAPLREQRGLDEVNAAVPGAGAMTVVYGLNGLLKTTPANVAVDWNGDKLSELTATGDVDHILLAGSSTLCPASPGQTLYAWNDWDHLNLNFRQSLMFEDGPHDGVLGAAMEELTGEAAASMAPSQDLAASLTVDRAQATGGQRLTYTAEAGNSGPATATAVSIDGTLPDGTSVTRAVPDLATGATARESFTYTVPCVTPDGTVLTGRARVSGTDKYGYPEVGTLADNTATATTTVRAPALALDVAAPSSAPSGEALTYTVTYRNTGGGDAPAATLSAVLPAGLYYSTALDTGGGPRPGSVVRNQDGTTTLTWPAGDIPAGAAATTIAFTARPSLLASGAAMTVPVSLRLPARDGCPFEPLTSSATTAVTAPAVTGDPHPVALWSLLPAQRTPEALARVQATDTAFDGTDGSAADGRLSQQEVSAAFLLPVLQPRTLRAELLACYLNLATRRIGADTAILRLYSPAPGPGTVRAAVERARATLALPVATNLASYTRDTLLLSQINSGLALNR